MSMDEISGEIIINEALSMDDMEIMALVPSDGLNELDMKREFFFLAMTESSSKPRESFM